MPNDDDRVKHLTALVTLDLPTRQRSFSVTHRPMALAEAVAEWRRLWPATHRIDLNNAAWLRREAWTALEAAYLTTQIHPLYVRGEWRLPIQEAIGRALLDACVDGFVEEVGVSAPPAAYIAALRRLGIACEWAGPAPDAGVNPWAAAMQEPAPGGKRSAHGFFRLVRAMVAQQPGRRITGTALFHFLRTQHTDAEFILEIENRFFWRTAQGLAATPITPKTLQDQIAAAKRKPATG